MLSEHYEQVRITTPVAYRAIMFVTRNVHVDVAVNRIANHRNYRAIVTDHVIRESVESDFSWDITSLCFTRNVCPFMMVQYLFT